MDVSYEDIRPTFEQIRHYFTYDLNLLKNQKDGGNYITALLVACACETLARFWYGKTITPEQFLAQKMLPDEFKPIARSLFDAIRNGIAHGYETKAIRVGDKLLDIGISWRQQPHLQFSPDKKVLYLNIQTMTGQILDLLNEYETLLVAEPQLRMQFSRAMRITWTEKPKDDELKAWKKLLGDST